MEIQDMQAPDIQAYEPSMKLGAKVSRKLLPLRARRTLKFNLERPLVSFTFDDFPRSARYQGGDILAMQGWRATFYVAAGLRDIENHHGDSFREVDLTHVRECGHEIAGHTYSHLDCAESSSEQVLAEIERNNTALKSMGVTKPIEHFAWPYGTANAAHKSALAKHFKSMRGVTSGVHHNKADLNMLKSTPLFSGAPLEEALELLQGMKEKPGWLIFFTHDVRNSPSQWGITPRDFAKAIAAVKDCGADVLPVGKAIQKLEGHHG